MDNRVLVIGSGPAGAHAAQTLVESGLRVTMLDVGRAGGPVLEESPGPDFEAVRRKNPDQWRWFLGEDFSGIPVDGMRGGLGGGMTSGNRGYVVRDAERLLPLSVRNGIVIQAVAKGGLGAAWGGTSTYLDAGTLRRLGLPPDEMERAYDAVTARIGVSGPQDRPGIQPPMRLDHHASALLDAAKRKAARITSMGVRFQQPHAAVLTQILGDRQPTAYGDLEYAADLGRSVYRPQYTVDALRHDERFEYVGGAIVERIDGRSVRWRDVSGTMRTTSAAAIIVAAGAVGTARILAASRGLSGMPLPFVGKPHAFSACVHPRMLGKAGPRERSSLCQLVALAAETGSDPGGCAQLYAYRSLLLFRLLESIPLAAPHALRLASMLSPALIVADIRFPAWEANGELRVDETGKVSISMRDGDWGPRARAMKRLHGAMRAVGLHPMKTMRLPEASTSHYAGTAPQSDHDGEFPLSTDAYGRVRGMDGVWVADAAMLRGLPASPHTLTIMANATRVAGHVAASLRANQNAKL
jgi:choline dehydrogenase-like flavoprotein